MKTILVGDCDAQNAFDMSDPEAKSESEFEHAAARVLSCLYKGYRCIVFTGGFRYEGRTYRPDLALVADDRSHWFVIEVELISHSLDGHVLPQVRAFAYGVPEPDCVTMLARELALEPSQAKTMLDYIPRAIAVIANRRDERWAVALNAHNVQFLTVSLFRSVSGIEAVALDGGLAVVAKSLGFGAYHATDRSLRFPRTVDLPRGDIQISDPFGAPSSWTVVEAGESVWVTTMHGVPGIDDGSWVQIVRAMDGRLILRRPHGGA